MIKQTIKQRLKELPRVEIFCMVCKKLLCTITTQRELICYDCWTEWKRKNKPPYRPLFP